jgi:hypothetical protein
VAHVIERDGSGYRFTHELLRQAMRSALTPERAQLIHLQLVSALQTSEGSPARVAYHLEQAGQVGAAIDWRIRAAEAALATYAYREAIDHYGWALTDGAAAAQAFEIRDRRIDVMRLAGLRQEREVEAQAMRTLAAALDDPKLRFRATLQSAIVASDFGAISDMERYALEALRWEAPSAVARIKLHSIAGFAASRLGRRGDALLQYEQAVELSQREQPRNLPTMAASASSAATCVGQLARARELTEIALDAGRLQPGTLFEALALSNTSIARRALGERAAAIAQLQAAVAISGRIGERLHVQAFLANQVEALCEDAQLEPARAALARLAAYAETGDAQSRYLYEFASVPVHGLAGDLGAAVKAARTSVALADEADDLSSRREARFQAAELLWQIGAYEECDGLTEEMAQITAQHGLGAPLELEVLRAAAEARARRFAQAADRLTAALQAPMTLRVLHWPRDAARVSLGCTMVALGRPADARSAVEGVDASVGLEMRALAVSVDAGASLELRTAARARLDRPGAPPLAALALGKSLCRAGPVSAHGVPDRLGAIAQHVADSLAGVPRLQGAFIRLHRDLLT